MRDKPRVLPLLAGIAVIAVWGLNFPLQKAILGQMSALTNVGARYLIVPVCALAMLAWRYGLDPRRWPRLPRADWAPLLRVALIGQALHLLLAAWGMEGSTAFSASLLLAVGPVFTLLILRLLGVERLSATQVGGVLLAAAGALAFTGDKLLQLQWRASAGDALLLVAALLFSYWTVASKPLIERHGGATVLGYATLLATPVALACAAPALAALPPLPAWVWWGQLWQVAGGGFLGWLAWGWANEQRGVARTAPLIYLMPLVAGLASWSLGGEAFGAAKLAAAALVLAGVALAQFGGRRKA